MIISMNSGPAHRRFVFSLRMMFVLLTLLAVLSAWTAVQLNWIKERHAFLAEISGRAGVVRASDEVVNRMTPQQAPWSLRPFGEPAIGLIVLTPYQDQEWHWRRRAENLFPEAACVAQER
jgi:hypothetical protein